MFVQKIFRQVGAQSLEQHAAHLPLPDVVHVQLLYVCSNFSLLFSDNGLNFTLIYDNSSCFLL